MIASSRSIKIVALSIALVAHGALSLALMVNEEAQIEGAPGVSQVQLGNSFADMVAGSVSADEAEDVVEEQDPTERLEPEAPQEVAEEQQPDALEAEPPEQLSETPEPEEAIPSPTAPALTAQTPQTLAATAPSVAAPTTPTVATPTTPSVATPTTPTPSVTPVLPSQSEVQPDKNLPLLAAQPAKPAEVQPETPQITAKPEAIPSEPVKPEVVTSEEPQSTAVTRSKRPPIRPKTVEARKTPPKPKATAKAAPKKKAPVKAKPQPQPQPQKKVAAKAKPAGNAQKNAVQGKATGSEAAKSTKTGGGGKKKTAGNAAVSNYPGKVMRKISRARQPRSNTRTPVKIGFTIAGNGGIAKIWVAASSGSAKLDKAALRMVRSAAPFPKPPAGAQRSFSINIKGR